MLMPSMDIDYPNPKGLKVLFADKNGSDFDREFALKMGLEPGQMYTVDRLEVGSWSSTVYLEETNHLTFPNGGQVCFNSVMFLEPHKWPLND